MTFGDEGKEGARVYNVKDVEAILDVFQAHGHYEVWSHSSPSLPIMLLFSSALLVILNR